MYYKVGGSLKYNHPTYVERQADRELLNLLQSGEYCLVLNSRQMGKSSLRVRTGKKLKELGIKSAFIDLTLLGNSSSEETRIKGFVSQLLSSLDLETELNLSQWWEQYQYLTPLQKLDKLIESIILVKINRQIVIFIDEIDSLLKIPQKDDFFAFIRACYNKRADNELYDRLCFCLLGVVSPSNLIQDKQGTPFNIGRSIDLTGLTFSEAKDALIPGLATVIDNPESTLKDILYWTGGQPFLTQKLCALTVDNSVNKQANVGEIVEKYIITGWESQDVPEHLRTIRDRLTDDESKTIQLLRLYQRILQGETIVSDQSESQIQLRLSGLIVKKDNYLQVYNPIYQTIFNLNWVEEQLNSLRPYSEAINKWLNNQKNSQYLLQGTDLAKVWEWSESRKLGNIDYEFLSACQKYQGDKEKQAKDVLAKANQKAEKDIKKGKIILGITISLSLIIASGITWYARKQVQKANIADLNKSATEARQVFDTGEELEALSTAIATAKKLQKQFGNKNITDYPITQPIETLNYILNNINEKNKIKVSESSISALAFSSDNQTIVIGDKTGTVKLWNSQSNKIKTLNKLPNEITKIIFTSNDNILVSDRGGTIQLWDIKSNILNILKAENVSTFALTPDKKIIVVGDEAGNLSLWSKEGKAIASPWKAHQGNITSIAVSPDGQTIASASDDTAIALWTKEGERITILTGHRNAINSLAFNPNKPILASASSDGTIKLWNIRGQPKLIKDLPNYQNTVESIAFSPDGHTLISGSSDRTLKLWKINNSLRESGTLQENWQESSTVTHVLFSSDGQTIASGDEKGTLTLWSNPTTKIQGIEAATFNPDSQTIITSTPSEIRIKKLDGTAINTVVPIPNKIISSISMTPNNDLLIAGTEDGEIGLIDLNQSQSWKFVRWKNQQKDDAAYQGKVVELQYNSKNKSFISLGLDRQASVIKNWDRQGNLLSNNINLRSENSVVAFDYNTQGSNFILAYENGEIELCSKDCSSSQKIIKAENNLTNLRKDIAKIRFHPDGKIFAVAYHDGTIQLRQLDGTLISSFDNKPSNIGDNIIGSKVEQIKYLDFTSDGNTINAISSKGVVSSWTLDLGRLLKMRM